MKLLSDLDQNSTVPDLAESLAHLNKRGHAATAMMVTSKLEQWLKMALTQHFANSPRHLLKKLFNYNGPIGVFSAKIDVAYAVGAVSQDTHKILHILRDIRNIFAHADDYMDFDHETMDSHFAKIDKGENRETIFLDAAVNCINDVKRNLEPIIMATAVREHARASRGKSSRLNPRKSGQTPDQI